MAFVLLTRKAPLLRLVKVFKVCCMEFVCIQGATMQPDEMTNTQSKELRLTFSGKMEL